MFEGPSVPGPGVGCPTVMGADIAGSVRRMLCVAIANGSLRAAWSRSMGYRAYGIFAVAANHAFPIQHVQAAYAGIPQTVGCDAIGGVAPYDIAIVVASSMTVLVGASHSTLA